MPTLFQTFAKFDQSQTLGGAHIRGLDMISSMLFTEVKTAMRSGNSQTAMSIVAAR